MKSAIAARLIEQFAAQAPFAVWITDSRGISIFANKKLSQMFEIPDRSASALGLNLFDDPAMKGLQIDEIARRAQKGEFVELILKIEAPDQLKSQLPIGRKKPLTLRANCYALRATDQKIQYYVIVLRDVGEAYEHREKIRQRLRDLAIFNKSKAARTTRLSELREEEAKLEAEISRLGGTPVNGK